MSETAVDFAILGSTPQARLLAGLLASEHGYRVALAAASDAAYRLPRGLDLSAGAITRPETWSLLTALVPETVKLLSRIGGRSAWGRTDPILFADQAAAAEAISHVRHMASAFGIAAERVPPDLIGQGRTAIYLRDCVVLHRASLETHLDAWLDRLGVVRLGGAVSIHPDGSGSGLAGDIHCSLARVVLADDTALLQHLPADTWPPLLVREIGNSLLLEPIAPMAGVVMQQLDTGMTLHRQPHGGLLAMGRGPLDDFSGRLTALLGPERVPRPAGRSQYVSVSSANGATVVGRIGGTGADILAGFGVTGAFFAPAIARWLSGRASAAESAWFEGRRIDRSTAASAAAEFRGAA
jgi:hypothetical protein